MPSLSAISRMSAQAVYDALSQHLLTQKKTCLQSDGLTPAYRTQGTASPAGALLSDEEYLPAMEGRSWLSLAQAGIVPRQHALLIDDIEFVHISYPPYEWPQELANVARLHGLSITLAA